MRKYGLDVGEEANAPDARQLERFRRARRIWASRLPAKDHLPEEEEIFEEEAVVAISEGMVYRLYFADCYDFRSAWFDAPKAPSGVDELA